MTTKSFWIALLVAITAALIGCGAPAPSNSVVPRDDAATNNPETAVAPDAPSPPPDVPVITADAGSPTPDAATPVDAAVTPDAPAPTDVAPVDTGTPPDMATMMAIILRFNSHEWHASGTSARGAINGQLMNGRFEIVISTSIQVDTGARYEYGGCNPTTMQCTLPETVATDGCLWTNLSPTMVTFHSNCHGREVDIEMGAAH